MPAGYWSTDVYWDFVVMISDDNRRLASSYSQLMFCQWVDAEIRWNYYEPKKITRLKTSSIGIIFEPLWWLLSVSDLHIYSLLNKSHFIYANPRTCRCMWTIPIVFTLPTQINWTYYFGVIACYSMICKTKRRVIINLVRGEFDFHIVLGHDRGHGKVKNKLSNKSIYDTQSAGIDSEIQGLLRFRQEGSVRSMKPVSTLHCRTHWRTGWRR